MKVFAPIAIAFTALPAVLGHGYMSDPAPVWSTGYAVNGFGSTIDSNMWGAIDNSVYGYGTDGTVAFFSAEFNKSGYGSLGQFIITNQVLYSDAIDEECGYTIYDDSERATLPATNLTYTGFTHPGPCEAWCDDTKLFYNDNCQTEWPAIPAGVPYDESLCANANRITFYWLALHSAPWQAYIDCVWIEGGGSGSGSAPSPVTATVSADVATAPPTASSSGSHQATTAYPSTSGSTTSSTTSSTSTTATTATTTATPTATTAAPFATTAATSTTSSGSVGDEASEEDDSASAEDEADSTTTAPFTTTAVPSATTEAPAATSSSSASDKCTASSRRRRRD